MEMLGAATLAFAVYGLFVVNPQTIGMKLGPRQVRGYI